MDISPVSGVRIAPALRPIQADLGLTDVYEIERSSRTGDETYSPSGTKAATGFEDDEDEYNAQEDEPEAESVAPPAANGQINYFA
jgi:hypothetical protein